MAALVSRGQDLRGHSPQPRGRGREQFTNTKPRDEHLRAALLELIFLENLERKVMLCSFLFKQLNNNDNAKRRLL